MKVIVVEVQSSGSGGAGGGLGTLNLQKALESLAL